MVVCGRSGGGGVWCHHFHHRVHNVRHPGKPLSLYLTQNWTCPSSCNRRRTTNNEPITWTEEKKLCWRRENKTKSHGGVCISRKTERLLNPVRRTAVPFWGTKVLRIRVVCPQSGTAVWPKRVKSFSLLLTMRRNRAVTRPTAVVVLARWKSGTGRWSPSTWNQSSAVLMDGLVRCAFGRSDDK